MKSKLVKYPFNDGKRYRWDTYKMGKKFEYTWEQSEPNNYETITPYIKAENVDNNTKYNYQYAILGDNVNLPYIKEDTNVINNKNYNFHYIRGSYGSNFVLVLNGDNPIEYAEKTIATITNSNYSTEWNLTENDFNYIVNNDISGNEIYQILLTNNPLNKNIRAFDVYYSDTEGSHADKWLYSNPEKKVEYFIEKSNNSIELRVKMSAFRLYEYDIHTDDNYLIFPAIKLITFDGLRLPSIEDWNYRISTIDSFVDKITLNNVLRKSIYVENAPQYDVGYTFDRIWNPGGYTTHTVYYVKGKTYTPPTSGYETRNFCPIELIEITELTQIGWWRYDTASTPPTGYVNEYRWGDPEKVYDMHWVSDEIKEKYSYNNALYGYRLNGNTHNCINISEVRRPDTVNGIINLYWPFDIKNTNGKDITLVPKDFITGANEIWNPITNVEYKTNIVNPLSAYDLNHIIRKSDWPSDLEKITDISSFFLNENMRFLKPDVKLIGDQTADVIIVPSGNTTIYSYTLGEPTDKQHLNPKSLQINAPCEYSDSVGYFETKHQITPDTAQYYGWSAYNNNGYLYVPKEYIGNDEISPMPTYDAEHFPENLPQIYMDNLAAWEPENRATQLITLLPNVAYYMPYATVNNGWYEELEPTLAVSSRTWLTFNSYTLEQWKNGYHFQGNQWNNIGSPWAYTGNMLAQGEHKMTYIDYEPVEEGTYLNIFSITDQTDTVVEDTLGNTFSTDPQTYYGNVGDLYFFGDDVVKSNNRNAYPDHGYQGKYMYILKPEETKFITYTNSTAETLNVELDKNRYLYTHDNAYFNRDTSLYGKVIGTATSTNEESIPDASWRKYRGLYLGESIPFLGIVETNIPESQILGVPAYDKQINTSETLKYGTVAAASLTFTVNLPVQDAMLYNNEYLILYYDFTHLDEWERMGFFYVDSIESIDENTSRITAHDETYKLNKYVDDFLEGYSGEVTLGKFYHDLLDYCDCYYDTKEADWRHYKLNNVYHAIKTTGIEVAHFVAAIAPGFIHTNIDGDIVLDQYENTSYSVGISDYADLQYTAYNSDLLNKVRITSNNAVIGEDTYNYGSNIYFVSDNPLISTLDTETTLNSLANTILNAYRKIPAYRPAEIQFLVLPKPTIGDIFSITTLGGDTYKVIAMGLSVDASGVKIKSLGTQTYPVEAQSNSQFINIINDIDSVSADVDNLENAQQMLGQAINQNKENIDTLDGRMDTAESNISTLTTNLQNKINNDSISQSNNLVSIKINGTTKNNITNKTYVDNAVNGAKTYADNAVAASEAKNSISSANDLVTAMINNNTITDIATKAYVDAQIGGGGGGGGAKIARVHLATPASMNFWYIGEDWNKTSLYKGLLIPAFYDTYAPSTYSNYCLFTVYDNQLYGLNLSTSKYDRISVSTGITVYSGWI